MANAPTYVGVTGLIRKYYVGTEDGAAVGGVYLRESRKHAEAVYDDAWLGRVTAAYGSAPEMTWFETPVVVDNRHNEVIDGSTP